MFWVVVRYEKGASILSPLFFPRWHENARQDGAVTEPRGEEQEVVRISDPYRRFLLPLRRYTEYPT